ncbi:MAG: elongation factor P maturation arginine rhamnosyltransferase EarP, partial [Burkholderiaceae bacterium]
EQIGVPDTSIELLRHGGRQVFLFCYASAPAHALAHCLAQQSRPSVLIVPKGVCPSIGTSQAQNVFIHEIPFVDQNAFDQLLWGSDLNFVRGEDSMVRALWAGKPLVWQIYEQDNDAHLAKLDAWLKRSGLEPAICDLMQAWNTRQGPDFDAKLNTLLNSDEWPTWQSDATRWSKTLASLADLATLLVAFCTEQRTG